MRSRSDGHLYLSADEKYTIERWLDGIDENVHPENNDDMELLNEEDAVTWDDINTQLAMAYTGLQRTTNVYRPPHMRG